MAQEAIKYTGKYTLLEQWAWFDFYDTIKWSDIKERTLKNTRYDEQIVIYVNKIKNKLSKINWFSRIWIFKNFFNDGNSN